MATSVCGRVVLPQTRFHWDARWAGYLKRTDTLKRKKEFRYTYRAGKSVNGRLVTLIYAKNRKNKVQIGFAVGKKIGGSVVRNRVKRRMREAVTPYIPQMKKGYNIVMIVREPIVDASFQTISDAVEDRLCRAGLLPEPVTLKS